MPELFAQVILPLSLHDSFTYRVPEAFQQLIQPGQRVVVQFGQKRLYAALVLVLTNTKPDNIDVKDIQQVLDDEPVLFPQNLHLWQWMASYYCCKLGDVFRAALPSGLKLESKSQISLTGIDSENELSEKERLILFNLNETRIFLDELQKKVGAGFSFAALKLLLAKNIISVEEKVEEKYKPKTETYVRLHHQILSSEILDTKISEVRKAKKQVELLYHFLLKTNFSEENYHTEINQKALFEGTAFNVTMLNGLCKKNILFKYDKQVSRIDVEETLQTSMNMLNGHQAHALSEIKEAFETKQVTLIHGITASGKTEIYIHLIDEAMRQGKQVLYLVPEIALTNQIIRRLKSVFSEKVGIYHSRLNNAERVEVWEKVLRFKNEPSKGYQVVLGARSSIFLPFSNLGLVIVDEEHENSFKQYDPAPRYHARDMAIVLANHWDAKVLLGSATPSFESYFNALTGKYGLVNLHKMHANVALPEIVIADLLEARKRRKMHSLLTPGLYKLTNEALAKNEQVIFFQNRRGYSPFVECHSCGWIPKCVNCDVSLTYYRQRNQLTCHYCGYTRRLNETCDQCASPEVKTRGYGTEKVEDELKLLFKSARIVRMDLDTTGTKNAFEKIIHNLESRKTDILVGTQMVTKGLDFEHVSIVGILNADNLVNFPDFRAHERAYQLMSQVSGRAGRKHSQGKVVVQTIQPTHPIFDFIRTQDYRSFYNTQMAERKLFHYPPYFRLIKLVVKHKNIEVVERVSAALAGELRRIQLLIVLGPGFPLVSRIQLWFHKEIWLKFDRRQNSSKIKMEIEQAIFVVKQLPLNSSCSINIDVDPY